VGLGGGRAGDVAFRMYTVAGIVMGFVLGVLTIVSRGFAGLDRAASFLATLGVSTLVFVGLIPYVRARAGPSVVRGETARAVMIGFLSYYPLVYVVWSAVYQTYVLFSG